MTWLPLFTWAKLFCERDEITRNACKVCLKITRKNEVLIDEGDNFQIHNIGKTTLIHGHGVPVGTNT